MNLDYRICNILTKKEVYAIRKILGKSKNWKDGLETTKGFSKKTKNNEENYSKEVQKIIIEGYKNSSDSCEFTISESITNPIVSQMKKGGYYKPHLDAPKLGQYSTTLFLSEPSEYEGGELLLYIGGSTKKIKLSAGKAIVYKSGTPHCVSKVLNGTRLVSVAWIKSLIKEQYDRELACMIRDLGKKLSYKYKDFEKSTFEFEDLKEAMSDPYFAYRNILHYIESKYPHF